MQSNINSTTLLKNKRSNFHIYVQQEQLKDADADAINILLNILDNEEERRRNNNNSIIDDCFQCYEELALNEDIFSIIDNMSTTSKEEDKIETVPEEAQMQIEAVPEENQINFDLSYSNLPSNNNLAAIVEGILDVSGEIDSKASSASLVNLIPLEVINNDNSSTNSNNIGTISSKESPLEANFKIINNLYVPEEERSNCLDSNCADCNQESFNEIKFLRENCSLDSNDLYYAKFSPFTVESKPEKEKAIEEAINVIEDAICTDDNASYTDDDDVEYIIDASIHSFCTLTESD